MRLGRAGIMAEGSDQRSIQDVLDLAEIPGRSEESSKGMRLMGRRSGWIPGQGSFEVGSAVMGPGRMPRLPSATYGGHVYAGGAWACCRAMRKLEDRNQVLKTERLGLHSIHGFFTDRGIDDRTTIYDVTPVSISHNFSTISVIARQPSIPSTNPAGDHFPPEDASQPLNPSYFNAVCSFKLAEPHAEPTPAGNAQEPPPQTRFASILSRRAPSTWPPSPPIDIEGIVLAVGADLIGTFPGLELRKVDMGAFNADKPLHEKRELILYRLHTPLPADGTDGWDANAHVVAHAYGADRNGLLMLANQAGWGLRFGRAATLSYSFVVHVNAEEAVMRFGDGDAGWWVQEVCFPRTAAGRGIVMTKIWSPEGVHVATEYQDGLVKPLDLERKKRKNGARKEEKL